MEYWNDSWAPFQQPTIVDPLVGYGSASTQSIHVHPESGTHGYQSNDNFAAGEASAHPWWLEPRPFHAFSSSPGPTSHLIDAPQAKIHHSSIAYENCRQSGRECDEGLPCRACETADVECIKRSPKPNPHGGLAEAIVDLTAEVQRVRQSMDGMRSEILAPFNQSERPMSIVTEVEIGWIPRLIDLMKREPSIKVSFPPNLSEANPATIILPMEVSRRLLRDVVVQNEDAE